MVDGGGSSDPDGDPLTFSWTLLRSGSVIGNYNGSTLSVTLNKPGTYSVRLTVRDSRGGSSSATTEINSYYTVPSPPPPVHQTRVAAPAAMVPSVVSAVPAPAPNARISAASIGGPQGAAAPAAAALWGAAAPAPAAAAAGYYPAAAPAVQQQVYVQPQQQQQLLPVYQQPLQLSYQQQQQLYQPQQLPMLQQQQPYTAAAAPAAPAGVTVMPQGYQLPMPMPQQPPAAATMPLGMCLFNKDGKPNYSPWDAAAAMAGKLGNSYWGPCPTTTATGVPTAPALPPAAASPPSADAAATAAAAASPAPVSGSSVAAASTAAAEPATSSAGIRSPEAFVKSEGPATQVILAQLGTT